MRKARGLPYLRLLGAQLAIGAAAIFARYALGGAGPLAVSALRLTIAALPFLAFAVLFGPRVRFELRREATLALAGTALALHFAAWIASLLYTSVALATLLVTTTPLWTGIYDALNERRRPSRAYLAALALAALGLAAIVAQRTAPAPIPGRALWGDGLALGGSVAIGAYFVLVRHVTLARESQNTLPTGAIVARTYGWAALALAVAAAFSHQAPPALGDAAAWLGILAMALVSQALGHTALNAALRDFTPSTVAFSTLLEPIVAAIFAALLFREGLGVPAIGGALAVLGAVALALRDRPPREPRALEVATVAT
jgi:drug/metabolite transporter (DMT)-like permease